jgi:hypothetical protein
MSTNSEKCNTLYRIEQYVRTAHMLLETGQHPAGSLEERSARQLAWAVQALVSLQRDLKAESRVSL